MDMLFLCLLVCELAQRARGAFGFSFFIHLRKFFLFGFIVDFNTSGQNTSTKNTEMSQKHYKLICRKALLSSQKLETSLLLLWVVSQKVRQK